MKKLILIAFTLCSIAGFAQEPPKAVTDAFAKKYPTAVDPSWSESDLGYEVYFELGKEDITSEFSTTGTWVNSQQEVGEKELSEAIDKTLKSNFKEYSIDNILLIKTKSKSFYEIQLWNENDSEYLIQISHDGKLLKKELQQSDEYEEESEF